MHETPKDIVHFLKTLTPREPIKWPEEDTLWNASTLHWCQRLQILRAKGVQLRLDPNLQRKFSLRKAIHEAVQEWITQNITPVAVEKFFIDRENRISGRCDVLLPMTNPPYVIEIKTFRSRHVINGYLSGKYQPYWLRQMGFYYQQAAKEYGAQLRPVTLLIDVEEGTPEVLPHDPNELPDYKPLCDELNACWDADMLPPMKEDCGDCPLKSVCTEPIYSISEFYDYINRLRIENPDQWEMLIVKEEEQVCLDEES
ncbi:MAG: PD-(D/E)XK nuclease family protein [Deltaproteobacteria bacterium]|nr:PD-(D/E)XK nuclease family protein [Deltaproteobacteria bacterium]